MDNLSDEEIRYGQYCLSKAILQWLVYIKKLTPDEAREIDKYNKMGFYIGTDREAELLLTNF